MSYNWQEASTPKGRERLKELVHKDKVIAYFGHANKYMDVSKEVVDLALQFPRVIQSMKEYQDMVEALNTLKKYEDKYGKISK